MNSTRQPYLERFRVRLITEPTDEPVTLRLARNHLRIDADASGTPPSHPDDSWILDHLAAAREYCEGYAGIALAPQTLELALDRFPNACDDTDDVILLPFPPVRSVSSVKYTDGDGAEQTMSTSDYLVDTHSLPGRVTPTPGTNWPTPRTQTNAVRVRYEAGYLSPDDGVQPALPRSLRAAILLMLGHLYEFREESVAAEHGFVQALPLGTRHLLDRYSARRGFA